LARQLWKSQKKPFCFEYSSVKITGIGTTRCTKPSFSRRARWAWLARPFSEVRWALESSRLHVAKPFKVSTDLPIVIELIDSQEKIEAFLPALDSMIDSGLVTLESAEVLDYRQDPAKHR
jgi:hypothetical protein